MAWPSLLDIRTNVRDVLNEPTASKWSDAELTRLVNDAERDICIKTGCLDAVVSASTTNGSRLVSFTGHKVKYVEYVAATRIGLQKISPKVLGHVKIDGITPQFWFQWGTSVAIEPMPTAVYALYLYVSQYPSVEMSGNTDTPSIPVNCHPLFVDYVLFRAYLKVKKFGMAGGHYQQYIIAAQSISGSYEKQMRDRVGDLQIPDVVQEK
jgi:hypothetical protein